MASEGGSEKDDMDFEEEQNQPPADTMLPATATAPFDAREAKPNLEGTIEAGKMQ